MFRYLLKELKSFGPAFKGLRLMAQDHNFYFHFPAGLLVVGLGLYFGVERWEWLWLVTGIFSVWVTETLNTAIEKLTDLASPTFNQLAGRVKDIGAAAVTLAVFFAAIVGIIIFYPYITEN